MDLTPDALRETTFRGALRGYNVDDVDEFVERVAVGMAEVLAQLRKASERAAAADRRVKEVASSEDAMRRTLGHAQKLAEAVLAEAREEGARVTEEAHQAASQQRAALKDELAGERVAADAARADAERLLAEAQAARGALEAEIEAQRAVARATTEIERAAARVEVTAMVTRAAEGIDADLRAEIERLHGVRQALQLDVAVLASWMQDQREAARGVLAAALSAIEGAAPVDEPPPVADVDATIRIGGVPVVAAPDPSPASVVPPAAPPVPAEPAGWGAPGVVPSPPAGWAARTAPQQDATLRLPVGPEPGARVPVDFPDLSDEEFLAELKKATTGGDDFPFGPRDQGRPA